MGNPWFPTGPLLCARRSESAPGVPAGKAGLRPRSSVHEAPSVLPGVTGSHCVGLKSERRQQDSNLRAPERLRASNALPCHLGHASVRASRRAPCGDARRVRRCAKRKERESNPQGPQAHPFSRRDTAPVAVLPRSSLVPVVHACRVRGRRPASPAGRPRTGPRCRAQKEGARGGTMVPPRRRRDTAPVAVLPRVTPAGVEPATARVRVGSSAELSYGASMWPAGVEPAAPRVSGGRSTGLSYGHEMERVIHAQRCRGRRPALPAGRPDARSLRHVRKEGAGEPWVHPRRAPRVSGGRSTGRSYGHAVPLLRPSPGAEDRRRCESEGESLARPARRRTMLSKPLAYPSTLDRPPSGCATGGRTSYVEGRWSRSLHRSRRMSTRKPTLFTTLFFSQSEEGPFSLRRGLESS